MAGLHKGPGKRGGSEPEGRWGREGMLGYLCMLEEPLAAFMMRQLVAAVERLHAHKVAYRGITVNGRGGARRCWECCACNVHHARNVLRSMKV